MGLCDLCLAVAISKHAPRISSWPLKLLVEYVARMRFSRIQRSSSASDHAPWGSQADRQAVLQQTHLITHLIWINDLEFL